MEVDRDSFATRFICAAGEAVCFPIIDRDADSDAQRCESTRRSQASSHNALVRQFETWKRWQIPVCSGKVRQGGSQLRIKSLFQG